MKFSDKAAAKRVNVISCCSVSPEVSDFVFRVMDFLITSQTEIQKGTGTEKKFQEEKIFQKASERQNGINKEKN